MSLASNREAWAKIAGLISRVAWGESKVVGECVPMILNRMVTALLVPKRMQREEVNRNSGRPSSFPTSLQSCHPSVYSSLKSGYQT